MTKSLLIVSRRAPWAGPPAREALDIALAGGAFDLPLAMLFLDDGVFQLMRGQQPQALEQKDLQANLQALPLFGVETVFISQRALAERGLTAAECCLPVEILTDDQIRSLFQRYSQMVVL